MSFDDFHGEHMSTLTYGKHLHTYGKFIIMEVLRYYTKHPNRINDSDKKLNLDHALDDIFQKYTTEIDDAWNDLASAIEVKSPEGIMSYAFSAFKPSDGELLYKTFLTFGKIKPLDDANDWFNNFRLNGISNGMNLVVWQDNNKERTYGVRRDPEPLHDDVDLIDASHVVKILVNNLRRFIIENNLYQTNDEYKLVEPVYETMEDIKVCDECYKHYPFYYGGCHGCDFYRYSTLSLSIDELVQFMKRYPSAIVGYIVNTVTYASGNGKHWMSLTFKNMKANLICSGGKSFNDFEDSGVLNEILTRKGIAKDFNHVQIQKDRSTCGMYSVLSNYLMLCYDCNIKATVHKMGEDCSGLIDGKTIMSFIKAIAL